MKLTKTSGSRTRRISLAAVFAAVYFILRSIPTFQMIGISGRFSAGDFLLTTVALVAGLWSGPVSIIIGTILAYALRPPIFFGLDFLPAVVNVSVVSLLISKRHRLAQMIYIAIFLLYLASPYSLFLGYGNVPYTWLHILALVILLSPIASRIPAWLARDDSRQLATIIFLAFAGTMAQHLTGGLLYEFVVGFIGGISPTNFKEFWRLIFWLYPLERFLIVAISTIMAAAIYRSLRR